ncbi:protein GLUTAMINE DUMPER 3-like [Ipomoea triloba]|uniref:protein GLUTAMINE DUMPER 3-like n=1 Tax=Ipomoea triloba TaxID=35885 RepID=UPI00125E8473|nr:protein GLUTAMINE DUMPER 3-like [Ipomoea triloba]
MRPAHNTTSPADPTGFHRWNSPVPYLFGGLAIMLGLIALALMILACCYKKPAGENQDNNDDTDRQEKPPPAHVIMKPEMEPKFVVIMPGDHNPTCLAKPAICTRTDPDDVV